MKLSTGDVFADCAKDRELSLIRATGWLFHHHKSGNQSLCHQAAGRQTRWYFLFCICQNWRRKKLLECKMFQFQYESVNHFSRSSDGRLALVHGESLAFYVLVHCQDRVANPFVKEHQRSSGFESSIYMSAQSFTACTLKSFISHRRKHLNGMEEFPNEA